jgi:hypothetical protein
MAPSRGLSHVLSRGLSVVAFAVGALVTFTPHLAEAQEPTAAPADSADEEKRKGDESMLALRYEEALGHYRSAFEASHNPAILYNMGRAYEGLADFPRALDALEQFSDKAPPELKARVPKLDELLRDVRGHVATVVVSAPVDDAEIRLGERVVGRTKAGQVILRVNAGKQHLLVTKEGYFPFEREIALVGGRIETVDASLAIRATSGLLHVTSPVIGAAVSLDGKPVGTVPAESALAPGAHRVALTRDGYDPAEASVVIAAGERRELDVPMAKQASILGKWWFWTAVAVVAAGATATVIALTTERSPDSGTIPPGQVKAELRF